MFQRMRDPSWIQSEGNVSSLVMVRMNLVMVRMNLVTGSIILLRKRLLEAVM